MVPKRALLVASALLALLAAFVACEPNDVARLTQAAQGTAPGTAAPGTTVAPPTWWQPHGLIDWQVQLAGDLDLTVKADLYDFDGQLSDAATVQRVHDAGARALCYFDAGSIESYRPDFADFASSVLSDPNPEWPDERWLDLRSLDTAGPTGKTPRQLMAARVDDCKAKGFDGVDPDMTEVHTSGATFPNGGSPTADDNIAYVRWLATVAHERGMAISLKGDIGQAAQLEPVVDMTINEQCQAYRECELLRPFATAGKPILHIEYAAKDCPVTTPIGASMSSILKRASLTAERAPC